MSTGGRKWKLTQQIFWSSTVAAAGVLAGSYLTVKGVEPMAVLQWWSATQAGLLAMYGAANVIQKKITDGGGE